MKRYFNIVRALVEGKAVVIAKSPDDEKTVDVMVGKKLTKDAVKKGVPAVGAFIGAAINTKYINDIAWAARYMYQQRWLQINNKIIIADAQKG